MWKLRKKEASPVAQLSWPTAACDAPARDVPPETPSAEASHVESSRIGKSMMVKGEVSGSEDLYVDGAVEGSVALQEHSLIIGPNGRVRADVVAGDVIVRGTLDGNVLASERVELKQAAVLVGDIVTPRIAIEDGACFKGSIDVHKEAAARHAESIERPLGGRKAS